MNISGEAMKMKVTLILLMAVICFSELEHVHINWDVYKYLSVYNIGDTNAIFLKLQCHV